MVQCFAPDCNHLSESRVEFLVSLSREKSGWIQEVDWSIEASKGFVFIYYVKLKNAVRPKVRYVCTINCNSGGHICHVQVCFYLFRLVSK